MQLHFHSLVDQQAKNSLVLSELRKQEQGGQETIQFMEGAIQLSKARKQSKLDAQATAERTEYRYQDRPAVLA